MCCSSHVAGQIVFGTLTQLDGQRRKETGGTTAAAGTGRAAGCGRAGGSQEVLSRGSVLCCSRCLSRRRLTAQGERVRDVVTWTALESLAWG